jgi:hypothetical protein
MENNKQEISAEALNYLEARSEDLRGYSLKLRQNVQSIFDRFGNKEYCGRCGHLPFEHDKKTNHNFTPKIQLDMGDFDSNEQFESSGRLSIKDNEMMIRTYTNREYVYTKNLSRERVKRIVESGAIPKFIEELKERLGRVADEYATVSLMAEKLHKSIK